MVNIANRTKVEKIGADDEVLRLRATGIGSKLIARDLNKLYPEANFNATNIDNFFKSVKRATNLNKVLAQKMDGQLARAELGLIGNWDKINTMISNVSQHAEDLRVKIEKSKSTYKEKLNSLRLLKDITMDVAKMAETRARVLGHIKTGTHINITNVENQYNDLKQLIVEGEGKFPGLGKYVEEKMMQE